jgi:uncharacterized protein
MPGHLNRDEILNFLHDNKAELGQRFGVIKLGLVGSFARDEGTDQSDIDIIVELQSENKFRSFFGLLHFLEDSLHRKIDLATEASLKPLVKKSIGSDIRYV